MKTILKDPNTPLIQALTNLGSIVETVDGTYLFLPFWFKELPDGTLEMYALNEPLPSDLKAVILDKRG